MKQKNDINRQNFVKQRTKYNRIKTKAKQKNKITEGQNLNTEARKQPKKVWRKIKSLRKNKSSKGQNLHVEDLLEHFKNTFCYNDDSLATESNDPTVNKAAYDPDLDCEITLEELKITTFHQKNNKSYGLDNACSESIKTSFDLIADYLLNIVNHIFNSGEYPKSWGQGIICPIFKGGDPDQASDYIINNQ